MTAEKNALDFQSLCFENVQETLLKNQKLRASFFFFYFIFLIGI